MKSENKPRYVVRLNSLALLGVFLLTAAVLAVPFYSAQSSSPQRGALSGEPSNPSRSGSLTASNFKPGPWSDRFRSLLPIPQSSPETIQTYAQDCSTPKDVFQLGETVCAKTDSVILADNWWVNWIYFGIDTVVVSGGQMDGAVTTNPQFFSYTPQAAGSYKVSLTNLPNDISQTPAGFTVVNPPPTQTVPLATYASDCTTAKASFNLGETVCIKVAGLSNDEFPLRRVQLGSPDGFVMKRYDITDNSQQFSYTLPTASTETIDGQTIDHRGDWTVAIIDTDANLRNWVKITVHKSNLLVDRVADLGVSKVLLLAPDPPPDQVLNLNFQVLISNVGPDPATNIRLADVTLPNTTFISFTRNAGPLAFNTVPNSGFGSFLGDELNSARFLRESGASVMMNPMPFVQDSSLTFNCVSPAVGSAGTTTCTATGELAVGETASFTAVYKLNSNIANGTSLRDENSATVSSDTADQFPSSNSQPATTTTSNPSPPACTITCPDNITVGTNATDGQGHPGAIVTFGPEPSGICGTGITSSTPSGNFFAVGPTSVTSTTGSGASCTFVVTVVNTPQPTISCGADQSAVAPSGQSSVAVAVPTPTYSGSFVQNQIPPPLTSSRSDQGEASDPYAIGTTTITWTVTDQYGTLRSCDQHVVVTSADAPRITCPSDRTFAANAGDCQKTLSAPDIGSPTTGGLNVVLSSSRSDGAALLDAPYPAGQTAITWTATNALGTASCTEVITITTTGDTTPPVLTIPADLNVTLAAGACSALLDDELGVATATDNCTPAVNVSRSGVPMVACPIPGNPTRMCESFVFPAGTTNVTYTATDAAGNTATGVQHVTVHETTPPTFTFVPSNLSFNTGPGATSCGTFVGDATLGTATIADNCDTTVIRSGVPAGNIFPVGSTTITYTARADITVTRTQIVTVVDNTVPVVTAPGPVTLYTGPGATSCGVTVSNLDTTFGTGSATDNCPNVGAVTLSGVPSGNVFPVGTTTLTYSATDAHNNTGSATQVVTVVDNTPPVITLNGANPMTVECHTSFTDPGATANDACNGPEAVTSTNNVNINVPGTYQVTYSAHDAANNSTTATRTVIVVDTIAPTILLKTFHGHHHGEDGEGDEDEDNDGPPNVIWPPNHKYHKIKVTNFVSGVSESCDTTLGINSVVIEQVTSDEAENAPGSGNTLNDIVIACNRKSVRLRAERIGGGNGRVYTITFKVTDASGNVGRVSVKVFVPKNEDSNSAVDDGPHYTVTNATCP
jgi:uncharacterized repeat protein (TIGR01451 family)